MEWSIFKEENPFVDVSKGYIDDVSYLSFTPKVYDGLLPTVIYYHGSHSSKEFKRFEAMLIAGFGYQVIVPDALYHGERDAIDYSVPNILNRHVWEIILQSVEESEKFIKGIIENHNIDSERICVLGSSMGAITAVSIFARNQKIKCLAGFNGLFDWQEAINKEILPISEEYKDLIIQNDPMNNRDKIINRPILILHGIDDQSVPIKLQKNFFNILQDNCQDKEIIKFIEFKNINHRITTAMVENLITWLRSTL